MESTLIVDNRDVAASGGRTFDRLDPVSGALATRAAAASVADAIAAVESCRAAFRGWAATGPGRRRAILLKAADLLEERSEQFVDAMRAETGATEAWMGFNVRTAAGMLREAAAVTTQIKGEVIPADKPGMFAMAVRRPVGVVLAIAPWNAPVILAVRGFCTALACGNCVVLKSSELSPATQYLLVCVMRDSGLPDGVLNLVSNAPGDAGEVVEAMIAHPAVRRVNFTGSTRTGRIIAQVAARHLKPALLELGGKAPMLVLRDSDVGNAVRAAAFGAFMHQGQICMSTERVVLDNAIADDFAAGLAGRARGITAADPRAGNAVLGSMISAAAADRAAELVRDAVAKGARLLAGGRVEVTMMDATVLDHVTPGMRIYDEESFAPIVTLVRVDGVDEAVRVANGTEFGLASSIFSSDIRQALEISARLDFGICHINGPSVHDEPQMPLGGMKASGYGRFGGQAGVDEFTEIQWVTIEDPNQHYPF